jgi:hypothetical protein
MMKLNEFIRREIDILQKFESLWKERNKLLEKEYPGDQDLKEWYNELFFFMRYKING